MEALAQPVSSPDKMHKGVIAEVCPSCEAVLHQVETSFSQATVEERLQDDPSNFFRANDRTRGDYYRYCVYDRKCRQC